MRTAFSYYGGKGMISGRYQAPIHKTIVEPFAGAAAYSCRYHDRNVILIDKNSRTCAIWRFLQSELANTVAIPTNVKPGDKVDDILTDLACQSEGLEWFLRSAANVGLSGTNKRTNTITWMAAKRWHHNTVRKIKHWHSKIQHWHIVCGSYTDAPDIEATWFIDPPYSNVAGSRYKHSATEINYSNLAEFVQTRRGQVFVCENAGADWLTGFEPVSAACGVGSKHISNSRADEVVWYNDNNCRQSDKKCHIQGSG